MEENLTLEQAEKKVKEMNDSPSEKFCPLINYGCRKDCVCFIKAWVKITSKDGVKKYEPQSGYCGNAMFDGERNCVNQ